MSTRSIPEAIVDLVTRWGTADDYTASGLDTARLRLMTEIFRHHGALRFLADMDRSWDFRDPPDDLADIADEYGIDLAARDPDQVIADLRDCIDETLADLDHQERTAADFQAAAETDRPGDDPDAPEASAETQGDHAS